MTDQATVVLEQAAQVRWREWEARGAANDRRTAVRMRRVLLLFVMALVLWGFVRLG